VCGGACCSGEGRTWPRMGERCFTPRMLACRKAILFCVNVPEAMHARSHTILFCVRVPDTMNAHTYARARARADGLVLRHST
jgi:hypothetical protein